MEKIEAKNIAKKLIDPEQLIKDNKAEFKFEDKMYRVITPTYKEKILASEAKDEKYMELLEKNDSTGKPIFKRKEQLIELYKKQGIDINEFDNEFKRLGEIIKKKQIELNSLTKQNKDDEDKEKIKSVKQQITVLQTKQVLTLNEKTELLRYSIEDKCENHYLQVLIVQCTEVFINNNWEKLYKNIDEFNNGNEALNNRINFIAAYLFTRNDIE